MTTTNTLARRVTWALTMTVALFVGMVSLLAFSVMSEQEDELANQLVQIEMRRLIGRLQSGDVHPIAQPIELGPKLEAWIGASADGASTLPVELRGLTVGPHEIETPAKVLHALVADSTFGRINVVFDATSNEQRVSEFGVILLALWAMCVGAGYWLARATARIVVGPMRAVTERIADWDPDIAHAEDACASSSDEAGRLLQAFNRMQDRVDRSIAREREFAANLSHEVRTPLAGLRTDVEMAGLDAQATPDQRQRFERMTQSIDEIGATIGAARAMSQPRLSSARQTFAVDRLVDDVWSSFGERGAAAGLRLSNRLPAEHVVFCDRYALLIVLRNLISNAIDHAAPATLMVALEHGGLLISDNGPGIAARDLPFVFDRYHHGRLSDQTVVDEEVADEPRGLGLAITRRVCEQQGWVIGVESATDGAHHGTRFRLIFDENST